MIVADHNDKIILNLEGKTYLNKEEGIKDIKSFDVVEEEYIKPEYPEYKILRGVVLFGSRETKIVDKEVIFLLTSEGKMVTSENTPNIILTAIKSIIDFNKK